jgi:o-succinylbenzoate---CoA ligase
MLVYTNYKDIFNLSEEDVEKIDVDLFDFLKFWNSSNATIEVETSGSTGSPKKISLKREAMISSAKATIEYFNIKEMSTFHCCLPIKYIGGKMMLVRAIVNKADIILSKPTSNPVIYLNKEVDFSAMTPWQVSHAINENNFEKINKLIIGGGVISSSLIKELKDKKTESFQTYGMTETISHIAVRNLKNTDKNPNYKCLNHVNISTNKEGELIVKSPKLGIRSLTTNDIVQITGSKEFKYIARSDNLINTGGIKVLPEEIEKQLNESLQGIVFFVDKIPDEKSGEKIIVITNKKENTATIKKACKHITPKHIKPQLIFFIEQFLLTENNKLNRKKTRNNAVKTNDWISI